MHAVACGCCLKREGILRSGAPVRRSVTAPCTYFRIYIPSDANGRDAVSAATYRCTHSSRGCCDREPAVERRAPLRALHCAGFTTLIGTYRYTSPAFPVHAVRNSDTAVTWTSETTASLECSVHHRYLVEVPIQEATTVRPSTAATASPDSCRA